MLETPRLLISALGSIPAALGTNTAFLRLEEFAPDRKLSNWQDYQRAGRRSTSKIWLMREESLSETNDADL